MSKSIKPKVEPVDSNWLVIKLGYSDAIVLPYRQGVEVISNLDKAESLNETYDEETKTIKPIKNKAEFYVLSNEDYIRYRMNNILGVANE